MAGSKSLAAVLAALLAAGTAPVAAQGIYTCTDSKGRRLTADRPILDCIDREQTELSSGGLPRRKLGPSLTADERAAEDRKARKLEEERSRANEEKKRERALVMRYPGRALHDQERQTALALVDSGSAAAHTRTKELLVQRKQLEGELEFYRKDPSHTPPRLRRQVAEVDEHLEAQKRFLANQEAEKTRVNARFDEELGRLKLLWAQQGNVPVAGASGATVARAASAVSRPASSSAVR